MSKENEEQEQAKRAQEERAQEEREAWDKLRESRESRARDNVSAKRQSDVQKRWELAHFWIYWEKVNDDAQFNEEEPGVGGLSDRPKPSKPLGAGTYNKQGGKPPIQANFSYDREEKTFKVQINIGGLRPSSVGEWDKRAEISAKEAVRFMANVGFTSIKVNFSTKCEFLTGLGGNWGTGTLAYAEKFVHAALDEAIKRGVGFDASDEMFKKFMDKVFQQRGKAAWDKLQNKIIEANKNREQQRKPLNEVTNQDEHSHNIVEQGKSLNLEDHREKLERADKVEEEKDYLNQQIVAILKGIEDQIDKETDPAKQQELRKSKADLEGINRELAASGDDREAFEALKEQFENFIASNNDESQKVISGMAIERIDGRLNDLEGAVQALKEAAQQDQADLDESVVDGLQGAIQSEQQKLQDVIEKLPDNSEEKKRLNGRLEGISPELEDAKKAIQDKRQDRAAPSPSLH